MPGHHALSKDGAHFAVAMPDGRIQLWSVRSGKLVTVLSHEKTAASRISSLLFSATGSLLLAGLHSGEVVAYTVSTAGVLFSVRCGNQKRKVTSIQSSADDTTVFAASADGSVYVIDVGSQAVLSSFSAGKVVQMLVLSARYIVTASSRISLWDLSTMKCIASRSGHASSVASLAAFSPPSTSGEGLFLASCAENDRFISFWDMSESGSELAVRVVPCSSAPTWLAVTASGPRLAVLTDAAEVLIFDLKNFEEPLLLLTAKDANKDSLHAVGFRSSSEVLLVRGDLVRPVFESIAVPKKKQSTELVLAALPKDIAGDGRSGTVAERRNTAQDPELEVSAAPSTKRPRVTVDDEGRVQQRTSHGTATSPLSASVPADALLTIEEQLKALSTLEGSLEYLPQKAEKGSVPTASSLSGALIQALQSSDSSLFEQVIVSAAGDSRTISASLQRLPSSFVPAILKQVANRLSSKPGRATLLVPWLKAVLTVHASYLASSRACTATLSSLYAAVENRLRHHSSLIRLNGRLDLLLAQISRRREVPQVAQTVEIDLDAGEDMDDENQDTVESSSDESSTDNVDQEDDDEQEQDEDKDEGADRSEADEDE